MKKLTITLLLAAALPLSGCAATSAGVKKGDERNFARSLNDVSAARAIKARMTRVEGYDLKGVDVEVAEGIALLSGNVSSQKARVEAERIAWSAPRVSKVGNELFVNDRQGLGGDVKDRFINSKLKARLTADKAVKARNYNIEVNQGTVYLLGVARTPQELERAAHLANTTKGVKKVVSYVRIAYSARPMSSTVNSEYVVPYVAPQTVVPQVAPPQALPQQSYPEYQVPQSVAIAPEPARPLAVPVPLDAIPLETAPPQYYLDPQTGEYHLIEPNMGVPSVPTDQNLGSYNSGVIGEAVPVIENEPFYLDPDTGEHIPLSEVMGWQ